MGSALGWAFVAAFNPTLLAAVTAMLMLPKPRRLLFGYLLGALMTSNALGLLIVFELKSTDRTVSLAKHTISPIVDITIGVLLLVIAGVIAGAVGKQVRVRRARKRAAAAAKPPPRWRRALDKGSARATFVVGALLTLPGGAYLAGMNDIARAGAAKSLTVLAVLLFNTIMLTLVELPLLGSLVAPDWTDRTVARASAFLRANGARIAMWIALVLGTILVVRGILEAL